jgi:phosphatidylserine/phosphatidylglycerophosphate/cardiolipin synthase-like enzyme
MADIQDQLIELLALRASLCSRVFKAWAHIGSDIAVGVKELTAAAHLSYTEEAGTSEMLRILRDLSLLEGHPPRWKPSSALAGQLEQLGMVFGAIDVYRSRVHRDATEVKLVTTKPQRAISLVRELDQAGWQAVRSEDTDESIQSLFSEASKRLVVMTPFLDKPGAGILKTLLERTRDGIEIVLVLRYLDRPDRNDYPDGYAWLAEWLRGRGVLVFNYSLQHSPDTPIETFHAKLVLADGARAYVGSVNMTRSSFENSVELGVIVSGAAARQLEHFIDAVLRCAHPWNPSTIRSET